MTEFGEVPQPASSGGYSEIQRNITSSLRFPAYGEDPAVFSGPPKVTITRDSDGAQILKEVEATEVPESKDDIAHFVVEVTGTDVPEADRLEVVWSDGASSYTTFTEVVGGFVTSLKAIGRKLVSTAPEEELAEARELALLSIEDVCGVAFRRRYAREVFDGSGRHELLLRQPRLIRLLQVVVDDEELDVDSLVLDPVGALNRSSIWPAGRANVEVAYVHGYESFPPAGLPVRDLAAFLLTPSPTDWNDRATSVSNEYGNYSLVVEGVRGAEFPLPSVNAFVNRYRFVSVG